MMGTPLLVTQSLTKAFGSFKAVDDLSISFDDNTLYAIIGPNGAGKTTLFHLLSGVYQPTSGNIRFKGDDVTNRSVEEMAKRKLIRSYQINQLFDGFSVLENVRIAVQSNANPFNAWQNINDIPELTEQALRVLEQVGLREKADLDAGALSHGEQRTLEIAVSLGADPDLLLLDEPSSGMSPDETADVIRLVDELAEHIPIIIIEHKMGVVRKVADKVVVLHRGRIIAQGTPDQVRNEEQVRKVYLGEQTL